MKSHQCNTDPVTAADVVIVLWRQHIFFHRQQIPSVLKSSDSDCGDINSHNMLSGDNKIISNLVSHTTQHDASGPITQKLQVSLLNLRTAFI